MNIERVFAPYLRVAVFGVLALSGQLQSQMPWQNPLSPAAQPGPVAPAEPPAAPQQPLTAPDLDAFLDGIVPFQLNARMSRARWWSWSRMERCCIRRGTATPV